MICLLSVSWVLKHVLKQIIAEMQKKREQWKVTKDTRLVSFTQPDTQTGHPQSSPLEQGSPTSGISGLMIWSGADAIRIEIKDTINVMHLNHPQTIPTLPAAAKSLQSCPTLCDPIGGSPSGSPVPGILQARTLDWVPFPSPMCESEKWKWSCSVVSNS